MQNGVHGLRKRRRSEGAVRKKGDGKRQHVEKGSYYNLAIWSFIYA